MAPKLIANTSDIEAVAESDEADVPLMQGWRREVFGNVALELKHGRAMIGFRDGRAVITQSQLSSPAHFGGKAGQAFFHPLAHQVLQFLWHGELQRFAFGQSSRCAATCRAWRLKDIGQPEYRTQQMGPRDMAVIKQVISPSPMSSPS